MNFDMFNEIDYFTNLQDNNDKIDLEKNSNNMLYNPYKGFIKGNLFKNLYNSYKNFKPFNIPINSEQDEMMLNIRELSFASHELNLFLDNYPNNRDALNLFNKYKEMAKEEIKNYERRFGPLNITSDNMQMIPFKWESDTWPWEM